MKWIVCLLAGVLAFSVTGCAAGTQSQSTAATQSPSAQVADAEIVDPQGNVVLYVSNQSIALDRVDVVVEVDGKPVVDQSFDVGDQHDWKQFGLRLSPGRHELVARSAKGEATLRMPFTVKGDHWVAVSYWYNTKTQGTPTPKQFQFTIQDTPIGFL